jgi:hypothetical protein
MLGRRVADEFFSFLLHSFYSMVTVCLSATLVYCSTYVVLQGACVAFKPKYIRLAEETMKLYPSVEFYAVSCDDHKDVCKKFSIGTFPTILVLQEGGDQTGTKLKKGAMGRYSPSALGTALSLTESVTGGGSEQQGFGGVGVVDKRRRVQSDAGNDDDEDPEAGGSDGNGGDPIADPDDDDDDNNDTHDEDATANEPPSDDVMDGGAQDGSTEEGNNDDDSAPTDDSRDGLDAAAQGSAGDDSGEDFDEPSADLDDEAEDDGSDNDNTDETPQKFGGFVGGGQMAGVLGGNGGRPIQPQNGGRSTQPQLQGMIMKPAQINPPMIGGVGPIGRVKGAGSAMAQKSDLKRDMDRWQQMVLERKKLVEQRRKGLGRIIHKNKDQSMARPRRGQSTLAQMADPANAAPETATTAMLARTPGTPEYEERKAAILERIMKARKKGHSVTIKNIALKKESLPFSKDVRKPGLVRKQAERIPLVNRMVKMSAEEELILDASLSFIFGLRYGVYDSDKPLTPDKKRALEMWLDLVSVSLPPEWRLHILIDKLRNRMTLVSMSDKNLHAILDEYKMPRKSWSKSCSNRRTGGGTGGGFSCGFWKLMHSVTVGVAEHRGGLNLIDAEMVGQSTRTFSPIAAADTIRDYIANFFGCEECKVNFVENYDQCSNNRRCDRLASDAELSSVADWKELALWLWEVHNEISVRVVTERAEKKQKRYGDALATRNDIGSSARSRSQMQDEVTALWPDIATCLLCFDDDGHWNEPQVFKMLERTYWYEEDVISLLFCSDFSEAGWQSNRLMQRLVLYFRFLVIAIHNHPQGPTPIWTPKLTNYLPLREKRMVWEYSG